MTAATLTRTPRAGGVTAPPGGSDRQRRRRRAILLVPLGGLIPLLALIALVAGAGSPPCSATTPGAVTPAAGDRTPGLFTAPLTLTPGRWFRVGATRYGGPSDPSSSSYGSSGAYLPALPDSFAELSVLDRNPASTGTFTFQDANALGNLPYGTAIRVANGTRQQVLIKRDIGYGQGPGQNLPYRIDVWWHAADTLAVTKTPVAITLAPADGTAGTLNQLPASTLASTCTSVGLGRSQPLALTPGDQAQIAADGSASAPADAPVAVKLAIAAGNEIHTLPYPQPDVHYGPLPKLWPAYDCSGSVSYVLYKAGLHSPSADVSSSLERWGQPGPGRWITVYANSTHTFIDVAGRAFDTANYGGPNLPAGSGPRWRQDPTANLADGLSYIARHPTGL